MNDLERWVDVQGPQPRGVRELFDAARRPPETTPELKAELDALVCAAIAAHHNHQALKRRAARRAWTAAALGLLVACFAGAVAIASALRARAQLGKRSAEQGLVAPTPAPSALPPGPTPWQYAAPPPFGAPVSSPDR